MWSTILYITLVGLAAAEYGWKEGQEYIYEIRGRTMIGLHQQKDQYTGSLYKGKLVVQPIAEDTLNFLVKDFQQAQVHANLSSGWSSFIPDRLLSYHPVPLNDEPFEIKFKNGVVDKMSVNKDIPAWQVNMLKSIVSQLQVDTQAENIKTSKMNQVPTEGQTMGVYKTIEDTVTAETETLYDISPLPQYVLQSRPELAPLPHLRGDGQFIDIVKTKNYSNSDQRMVYHFGITGSTDWEPASNQMGSFLSRSTISRVIISGTLKSYTIQSSVTTDKIILAPHLYNNQKGIVASRMNLTLEAVSSSSGSPRPVPNPRTINNLVYEYNAATQEENAQNHNMQRQNQGGEQEDSSSSSSSESENDSSSSSSSSEERQHFKHDQQGRSRMDRTKRSVKSPNDKNRDSNKSGSSSSSSSDDSNSSDSDSSSSSSTSSSEEFWQPKPTLNQAPNSPFMPYFVGYHGNSIQASDKIKGVNAVYNLAKEIGEDVQNANSITGQNTLSKFSILVGVVHTMDAEQLQQASEKLYYPYSKASQSSEEDAEKYQAWIAYRDAVAEAGTGPALLTIKDWIEGHKIFGAEAAHIVGVLPNSARYPTTEYMNTFFELMKSEEVQKQPFLNTTAIIAFTDLVRKAQVNKDTAHNRYPVHSFGRLAPKNDKVVAENYITYLEEKLKKAVQQGDSPKIQVYIRALGNTAHSKILGVFEPYLEGQQDMSDFQRLTIVAALDKMTKVHPKLVRSVLFKIYQNSGEAPEVRVAAVMQLMKTNPPAQILQRMAQHTNYDHSRQVNAAVKSAIEGAARLQGPRSYQLSQNAKSAVHLLTTKEFGVHESHNFIRDFVVKGQELMYKSHLAYIQGEDSIIPSSAFYTLWRTLGGYKRQPLQFSWMTSGPGDLMDLLFDQFAEEEHSGSQKHKHGHSNVGESKWSLEKIGQLLNIQPEDGEQVEGNILVSLFGAKRLFAFDNHTIEQFPEFVKLAAKNLRNGQHFNYTKMYNQYVVQIGFPTATGLPFFYTFSTPTRAYLGGQIRAKTQPDLSGQHGRDAIEIPKTATVSGDFEITYTVKTEGVLGFITPHDHQTYVAGLAKNFHFGLPLRAAIEMDTDNKKFEAKFQPLEPNTKQKVFEYSTVAYTSKDDILSLKPFANGPETEEIHVRPVQRFETTLGQANTGFAFDVRAESEQKFIDWATIYNAIERYDGISAFTYPFYEESINNNNFTVIYNPHETTAKYTKLIVAYDELDVKQSGGSGGRSSHNKHRGGSRESGERGDNYAIPTSTDAGSEERQKEFLERAGANIQDSYAQLFDIAVQFEGQTKAEYVATAAYASSPVDKKSRYLFFFGKEPAKTTENTKPYQVALQLDTKTPNVPLTHFQKALGADPTSYISAKLNFGENVNSGGHQAYVQGKLKQSQGRRDYIQRHPLSAVCEQQMKEGNYIQPACRNATASANYLDQYKFTINYEGVPQILKQYIYKAYSVARYFGYKYVNEDVVTPKGKSGQVEIGVNFENDLKSVNISIESPALNAEFNNLYINRWVEPLIVVHPEYDIFDRFGQELFRAQHFPTCVIDKNLATTFDNRSYPIKVGRCWHAMVHPHLKSPFGYSEKSTQYDDDDLSILVRETGNNQKELLIFLGKNVVEVQPLGAADVLGQVTVNGQKADFSKDSLAQFKNHNGDILVQIYALPNGAVRLFAPETGIELIYDGERVKLQASNNFRGGLRGLCGTFDGEYVTDFTTPRNCILKDPFEFAASYALTDESCQGPAKELHERAQNAPCYRQTVMLGDIISEEEAGRHQPRMKLGQSNLLSGMGNNEARCSNHRVKVIEQSGNTCFSLRPLVACSSKCSAPKKIEKRVDFHCVPNSSATRHWVDMVRKGANPDFSQKPANAWIKVNVPERCVPN